MIPPRRLGQPGISVRILRGQGGWETGCRLAEAPRAPPVVSPLRAGPRRELFSHSSRKYIADIHPTHFSKEIWALNYLTDCTVCEVIQVPQS